MGSFQKFLIILGLLALSGASAYADGLWSMPGHVPSKAMARATHLGREASSDVVQMSVGLSVRNPDQLTDLIKKLYDPNDPLFHKFLTPEEFKAQFAPSEDDVNKVTNYLTSKGLKIKKIHGNRMLVEVEAPAAVVESAFQVELHDYITDRGRIAHAPTTNPVVSDAISSKINTVLGLSTFAHWSPHVRKNPNKIALNSENPQTTVGSYMTPAKIKSAYNMSTITQTGAGETIALFELDAYTASDITAYANYFSLTNPTLQNVLVGGVTGTTPGDGAVEVTLDIELAAALAPGATKILVYEGPNTSAGVVATYNQIHSDGLAFEVSTSWGEAENEMSSSEFSQENTIFSAMAVSGQSIFAAAGDSGAYDDSFDGINTLQVDDPGSQPYVTSVGGTHLTLNGSNAWSSETSWVATAATGTYNSSQSPGSQTAYTEAEGGGGGISTQWTTTSWQPASLATVANKGSTTHRMVPDVSLNADPSFGYPIYEGGSWSVYGGTSCAAPLWAAFTALVNQKRVANSLPRLGFVNPAVYAIGQSSSYGSAFHDIADGSTNLYYPAETGYDLTTGWGSFNGAGLFSLLSTTTSSPYAPSTFTGTPASLSAILSWTASGSAASYTISSSTSPSGPFTNPVSGITALQYTFSGLTYGDTYYYQITAVNSYGTSPVSATVSVAPYPAPPTAPLNLTATLNP